MSELLAAIDAASPKQTPVIIALRQYVRNGKEFDFQKFVKRRDDALRQFPYKALAALPPWEAFDEEAHRFLRAFVVLDVVDDILGQLVAMRTPSPESEEAAAAALLRAAGDGNAARLKVAGWIMATGGPALADAAGAPNAWGRLLLSLSDRDLAAVAEQSTDTVAALQLVAGHSPERVAALAPSFLFFRTGGHRFLNDEACAVLLNLDAARYEGVVAQAVERERRVGRRAAAVRHLAEHFPEQYEAAARKLALESLEASPAGEYEGDDDLALEWLLGRFGPAIAGELAPYFRRTNNRGLIEKLKSAVERLGPGAAPLVAAALENPRADVRNDALVRLIELKLPEYDETIRRGIEAGLEVDDEARLCAHVRLAGDWNRGAMAPQLWKLMEHRSSWVRESAVAELAKLGDRALGQAAELVVADKKQARAAAVDLLDRLSSPAAADALAARVDAETDEGIRRRIFTALDKAWERQGRRLGRADVEPRIERAAPRLADALPAWLDESTLPPLHYADGSGERLSPAAVRYLFYRQSRSKQAAPDIEAKPLFALIDRKRSGEFAEQVLRGYLGSEKLVRDRWALTLAALVGDIRIVEPLRRQIVPWADGKRSRLAEFATGALALVETDEALTAVYGLAARYERRRKYVGKAAREALAQAARRRGIPWSELAERLVPRLGFEPGNPRVVEAGGNRMEVRIGLDFKLKFRDVAAGKEASTPPDWVSAEVKAELEELAETIRDWVRMLKVGVDIEVSRQMRRPVDRWRGLYLEHAILFPFAVRMLWGCYDATGARRGVFRAREDGSLVDERGEAVVLSAMLSEGATVGATVGLVHPLELSDDERSQWAAQLAEQGITAPVRQLARPVVAVRPEEAELQISNRFEGVELDGSTFRWWAWRRGWQLGPADAERKIGFCLKEFRTAGIDVMLSVTGLHRDADVYSSVRFNAFTFAVGLSDPPPDDPKDDRDPTSAKFGEVPPIVYSETLSDLLRIVGEELPAEAGAGE